MFKKIVKTGLAALALAGFISTAQATGLGSGDGSWNGAYVGGHAGGGWGDADISAEFAELQQTSQDSFDLDGWLAGAHIGANVQHGAWVIGGELSLSAADIDGSKTTDCATISFDDESISFPCKKDDEWLALGMARFGYAPGAWMGYLTLGVAVVGAQTNNEIEFSEDGQTDGPFPLSAGSSTDVGFAIGGGAEFQLGNGLIAGVEYIHAEFDDIRDGSGFLVFDYSQDIDIVRARLSLMLDDCCGAVAPSKTGLAGGYAGVLPATGNPWSGVYFGGHVGGGWADTDVTFVSFDETFAETFRDSFDQDGWLAGVHLGAMVQRGHFVVGTELSLSAAEIDGSKGQNCSTIFGDDINLGCRKEDEWLLLAMSRFGYAPGNWMAYVTAGAAIVGAQTDTTLNGLDEGLFALPFTSGVNTDVGFAIGGGGEIKLGSNIIAGVEYIHAEFDDARNGDFLLVSEWEQDIDIVRARLSMMLNACCEGQATSKTGFASAGAATGWGGFYFGSNAAIGSADADVSFEDFDDGTTFTDSIDDMDGYLAGAHLGGNVQHGALVLGGELSVSAGEIDGSKGPDCFADVSDGAPVECKKEDEWLLLAMGRLGYAPGAWMAYVTAGAAVVGVQTDILSEGIPLTAGSDNDLGYAIGGGAEFQLGNGLIAGVEYIHAEFDGTQDGGEELVLDWEQEIDIVRARLSYKFGGCCQAAPAHVPLK